MTANELNQIYISNFSIETDISQVILVNTDLKPIKTFTCNGYFTCIKYQNGLIYICDKSNKQIVILDKDLNHIKTHQLDYNPLTLTISEETVCVRSLSMNKPHNKIDITELNFYDVKTFQLKSHNRKTGNYCITECDSFFYALNPLTMEICFYNCDGIVIEMFKLYKDCQETSFSKSFILNYKENILNIHSDVTSNSSIIYSL